MRSAIEWMFAFLFLALTVVFGGLLASGVSSSEFWFLPFLVYAALLPYVFVVFALRPRGQKRPGWLLMRIFVTPALAGLAEILFVAHADELGYVVVAVAILQMLVLSAWDAFQIVRLVVAPIMKMAARGETLPIFERIFALMDRVYLRNRPIRAWVAWDDTLESVIRPHPYYTVDQVARAIPWVLGVAAASWFLVLLLGWIGMGISGIWPIIADLDFAAAENMNFATWPLFVSAFLATLLSIVELILLPVGVYIIAEWNRRTWGAVVFRSYYFVFWVKAPFAISFRGGNEIESVRSTKRFSAGEKPGKDEKTPWQEQLWDGFTSTLSPAGVAAIALPVPALGGAEVIDFAGDDGPADGQIDVLRQIHELHGTVRGLKGEGLGKRMGTILLDPEREAEVLTFSGAGADVHAEVEQLTALYAQRVAEICHVPLAELEAHRVTGGHVVDLIALLRGGDPHRWSPTERRRLF